MTNAEKYKDLILNCENCCRDFVRPIVLKTYGKECDTIGCIRCQTLQFIFLNEEYQEPETDWSTVAEDTPILVSDTETDGWIKRHFAKIENGMVYAWDKGKTSYTADRYDFTGWDHAKLAEETQ